jgi:HEPN domain-containing protein
LAREEAKNWYEGALIDLEESKSALLNKRLNWALFAAHQAVEKALKAAYIILKRKRGPKTHDLTRLASVFDFLADFRPIVSELSPYYTVARYPNAAFERPWEAISEETAKAVVRRVGVELGFRSP